MTEIRLKRAYDEPAESDGKRILVERLWPRGVKKEAARIDFWSKATAPSTELRQWFGHDPDRWEEFQRRYCAELGAAPEAVERLLSEIQQPMVTFVFGSREERFNNAVALREFVLSRLE